MPSNDSNITSRSISISINTLSGLISNFINCFMYLQSHNIYLGHWMGLLLASPKHQGVKAWGRSLLVFRYAFIFNIYAFSL